ncbi:MAG: HipA N-terminal domain-containing protein [Christensenellaceae bacterium]|nr:HipA N-terminal domain-containing protein [Christensenellaceae bacterium]
MLPEGFTRRSVANRLQLDEDDYLGILYSLGMECIGALRIFRADDTKDSRYEKLNATRIK